MTRLPPSGLEALLKQYHWAGASLRRVHFAHRKGSLHLDIVLRVRTNLKSISDSARPKRLHLRCVDVEECRFQKRVGTQLAKVPTVKFAFLDGRYFLAFDDLSLTAGEKPGMHDFRAAEAYVAANDLFWAELPKLTAQPAEPLRAG